MIERALKLLDHSFLTRIGNLRTLLSMGTAAILIVTGLILAAVRLLANAGVVPLVFVGVGLVIGGLALLGKIRTRWSRAHPMPNTTIYVPKGRIPRLQHRHDIGSADAVGAKAWQLKAARTARQPVATSPLELRKATKDEWRQVAEALAARFHEGKVLRVRVNLDRVRGLSGMVNGTNEKHQIEREEIAHEWDRHVRADLPPILTYSWDQAADPIRDGSSRSLIEPTTDIAGVDRFLSAKLACLRSFIESFDELYARL